RKREHGMTKFLASVSNPLEAATILAAGADIIDIKDPLKGALGAVVPVLVTDIVKRVSGRVMTSATIGDLPMKAACISGAVENMTTNGVEIIKVGVFADSVPADILRLIKKYTARDCRVVLVFFADLKPQLEDFSVLAEAGVYGVMWDMGAKNNGFLREMIS